MSENCVFCKIIEGTIPSRTIYEDDYFKAILDISPAAPGHTVVISKTCAKDLLGLPDDAAARHTPFVKKVAGIIKDALGKDVAGINILQNNGAKAGQTVFHYHTHIIPRYEGDGVTVGWEAAKPSAEELDGLFSKIKGML